MAQVDIKRVEKIYTEAVRTGDWQRELEALAGLRLLFSQEGDRKKEARKYNELWKVALEKVLRERGKRLEREQLKTYLIDLRRSYKDASEYDFKSFLLFMEWDRKKEEKFYTPRSKALDECVKSLQRLEDGELDVLGISMPPRVGKSTLGLFYIAWVAGRHPEKSVFGSGYGTALMKSFYDGLIEIFTSSKYNYKEIFPNAQLCDTDSKGNIIDLGTPKRYKTISFASIDTSMSGRIEATSLLYVDDLIQNIEEARKPDRLFNAYMKYETDIKQRRKDKVPLLIIGTRWSLNDPIGVEQRNRADSTRAKFISIPALNEEGESNFVYPFGVGFSKEYYLDSKRTLDAIDPAIFMCVYQQQPIESEGVCFNQSSLKFYNGVLPEEGYVGTYLFGDCAWGGGDSFSAPIGAVYMIGNEKRVYVKDWIFTRELRNVTLKLNVMAIVSNKVQRVKYEANNGGDAFAADVDKELRRLGYHVEITWEKASNMQSKVDKILQYAADIKEQFYFLHDSKSSQQYRAAMLELTSWLVTGKSPHDDAPDGLTGLATLTLGKSKASVTILQSRYGL